MISRDSDRKNMVAISGVTGFLGKELVRLFFESDQIVIPLMRSDLEGSVEKLAEKIDGVGAIFNLAGTPVIRRWTAKTKKQIFDSRIETTRRLVEAVELTKEKPDMFFSASAVGIYDIYEVHDEFSSTYAGDFLSDVCIAWEREAMKLYGRHDIRLVIGRLGVVLGNSGGVFPKIKRAMDFRIGNKIGDGFQGLPFIHIADFLTAMWFFWKKSTCTGVFNIVAPQMLSNYEFADELIRISGKKPFFSIPVWLLKAVFGEGSEMFTKGPKVIPGRLHDANFPFRFPDIKRVLEDLWEHNEPEDRRWKPEE